MDNIWKQVESTHPGRVEAIRKFGNEVLQKNNAMRTNMHCSEGESVDIYARMRECDISITGWNANFMRFCRSGQSGQVGYWIDRTQDDCEFTVLSFLDRWFLFLRWQAFKQTHVFQDDEGIAVINGAPWSRRISINSSPTIFSLHYPLFPWRSPSLQCDGKAIQFPRRWPSRGEFTRINDVSRALGSSLHLALACIIWKEAFTLNTSGREPNWSSLRVLQRRRLK